jgi:anti-sigma B factor antagonist
MKPQPFDAKVRTQSGSVTIDLFGEINAFAESGINAAYTEAETTNPGTVVLNFTNVTYINSTGIALIVGLLAQARKTHRNLIVYGLSDHYTEIFKITRLSDFMSIYKDEESVLSNI